MFSPEDGLISTTAFTLIVGCGAFIFGSKLRYDISHFISEYGKGLRERIPAESCVVEDEDINFCGFSEDLSGLPLGDSLGLAADTIILTGFMVAVLSVLGFFGGYNTRNGGESNVKTVLVVMIILICPVIGLETYLLEIFTNLESSFHEAAKEELVSMLKSDYELANPPSNSFTSAMNIIMLQGECCGINGAEDFGNNLTYTSEEGKTYYFMAPPVCCRRELLNEKKFLEFCNIKDCKTDVVTLENGETSNVINSEGCYDTLFEHVYLNYGENLYHFLLVMMVWHLVDMGLAVIILMRPADAPDHIKGNGEYGNDDAEHSAATNDQNDPSAEKGGEESTRGASDGSMKFVPCAKQSSFVASNVNRAKSTEIW